jgi:hypothetical protein
VKISQSSDHPTLGSGQVVQGVHSGAKRGAHSDHLGP